MFRALFYESHFYGECTSVAAAVAALAAVAAVAAVAGFCIGGAEPKVHFLADKNVF